MPVKGKQTERALKECEPFKSVFPVHALRIHTENAMLGTITQERSLDLVAWSFSDPLFSLRYVVSFAVFLAEQASLENQMC